MKLIFTHTTHDFPGMTLKSSTTCGTIIHFQVLFHVMLTTRVTCESRSVYICKFYGEKIENTFHLLQVGEDRENTKNENNKFEQHRTKQYKT